MNPKLKAALKKWHDAEVRLDHFNNGILAARKGQCERARDDAKAAALAAVRAVFKLSTKVVPVLLFFFCSGAFAQPLRIAWDRHATHATNQAFALKWGVATNGITNRIAASSETTFHLTNGPWGALHLQAVAVSTNGIDSDPSNTIAVTNRPAAPLQLRIVPADETVQLEGSFNGGATWKPLAIVTNDPALILGSMSAMMMRARMVKPPPLP